MGTFRGHENSRNLKFNETQRGKRPSNERNELNEDEPAKVEHNETDKGRKYLISRNIFIFLCDSKTEAHVYLIYIST